SFDVVQIAALRCQNQLLIRVQIGTVVCRREHGGQRHYRCTDDCCFYQSHKFQSTLASCTRGASRSKPPPWAMILTTLPLLSFTKVIWVSNFEKNSVSDLGKSSSSGPPTAATWPNRCVLCRLMVRISPGIPRS